MCRPLPERPGSTHGVGVSLIRQSSIHSKLDTKAGARHGENHRVAAGTASSKTVEPNVPSSSCTGTRCKIYNGKWSFQFLSPVFPLSAVVVGEGMAGRIWTFAGSKACPEKPAASPRPAPHPLCQADPPPGSFYTVEDVSGSRTARSGLPFAGSVPRDKVMGSQALAVLESLPPAAPRR